MTAPDDAPKVTRLADVRRMTPHEIVDARRAGRLDLAAIGADKARRTAQRADTIRRLVRNGATLAEALEAADAVDAVDQGDDLPPAA